MLKNLPAILRLPGLLFACWLPAACVQEDGPDRYVLNISLPATVDDSDYVVVILADTAGLLVDSIYQGRPDSRRLRREAPHYDGGEALVYVQEYRFEGTGVNLSHVANLDWARLGRLAVETPIRIHSRLRINEVQEPTRLREAERPEPDSATPIVFPATRLQWSAGRFIDPQPEFHVYLGLANPPPSLGAGGPERFKDVENLLPDTVYYWRVLATRAGNQALGPVWSFRTRKAPPTTWVEYRLGNPGDTVLWRDSAVSLAPAWKLPNERFRFSVEPPLPPGLSLDSLTGILYGTPNATSPRTTYTVTLRSPAETLRVPLAFRVGTTANRVAAWNAEEGAGSLLTDGSGAGHHGTLEGTSWIPGVQGYALSLDGSAHALIPVRGALEVKGFTLSLWFMPAAQDEPHPLLEYSEANGILGLHVQADTRGNGLTTPGALYCNIRPSDAHPAQHGSVRERNILATGPGLAEAGLWNHVAVTFDAKTWKAAIYVNGRLEAARTLQADFVPLAKGRIHLGFRPADLKEEGAGTGFRGAMDEVEIFDGPLDSLTLVRKFRALSR